MASRPAVRPRPLSPHLQIWRWGPHMLVSILHRATGTAMATVGSALLVWFLLAMASGPEAYGTFRNLFTAKSGHLNIVGVIVGVGLTLCLFQHMMSGVRHLVMDTGAGFELRRNKRGALATMVLSVALTALFWIVLEVK